jgi:hypothetical protein
MQALAARQERETPAWLERMAAVVEAALGYVPETPSEIVKAFRGLESRAYRTLVVIHREDEPEPSVIEVRCIDPAGPVERARRLGLVLEIGGRCCVIYPSPARG